MAARSPEFYKLTDTEARSLLTRNNVGRIAYTFKDRVDIEPIHYVNEGDWLYGRTSMGTKLATLAHNQWCALETDEVHDTFDWKSVVVKGTFYLLDPETGMGDAYDRALILLRRFVPGTFSNRDPAPHRTVLFGIHINEITGRGARAARR